MEHTDVRELTDYAPYAEAQGRVRDLEAALSIHEATKEEAAERVQELQDQLDEAQVEELLEGNDDENEAVQILQQSLQEARAEVQAVEDKVRVHKKALERAKEKAAEELPKAKDHVRNRGRETHEKIVRRMVSAAMQLDEAIKAEKEMRSELIRVLANGGPTRKAHPPAPPLGKTMVSGNSISAVRLIAEAEAAGFDLADLTEDMEDELDEYRRTTTSVAVR